MIIRALHRAVEERFAATHGRVQGQQTALLAMGKLGGREMTAGSDLDLILVYDFDEAHPESDGAKPLYGGQYFARLTQRLISALTAQTNYGALYPVDMRLRPSGRSGPVATQLGAFESYQETEAWTWEHLALTRARVVSATPGVQGKGRSGDPHGAVPPPRSGRDRGRCRRDARAPSRPRKARARIWDLKYAAGGLIDIEFIAQYLQLVHAADQPDILDTSTARVLDKASRLGLLSKADAEVLRPAVRLYQNLGQILAALPRRAFRSEDRRPRAVAAACACGDVPDFTTLEAHVVETQQKVRQSFVRIVGRLSQH